MVLFTMQFVGFLLFVLRHKATSLYTSVTSLTIYDNTESSEHHHLILIPFMFSPAHTASGGMLPLVAVLN